MQRLFAPTDNPNRDVEMSVGSPSLVGTVVGNSSDAVINGRPMKKRPLLADVARVTPSCSDGVINQRAGILFLPFGRKRFSFYFPRRAVTDGYL